MFIKMEKFLSDIRPDLTHGSATFIIFFILSKLTMFFWRLEKESDAENIQRVSELSGRFKAQFIDPTLIKLIKEWVDSSYEKAIKLMISKAFNDEGELDCQKEAFSHDKIQRYKTELHYGDKIHGFFSSKKGNDFFEKLDQQYLRSRSFVDLYYKHIGNLRNLWISFGISSALMFSSFSKYLIDIPIYLAFLWKTAVIFAIFAIIVYFIFSEYYRRKINKIWRDYRLHGAL